MSAVTIHQMADRVAQLMEERLSTKGRDLPAKLRRGGRQLPRRVRDAAQRLSEASQTAQNPKLLSQIDMAGVSEDYDRCVRHLAALDQADRRRQYFSGVVVSVGFGVLAAAALVVGFLAWRTYF